MPDQVGLELIAGQLDQSHPGAVRSTTFFRDRGTVVNAPPNQDVGQRLIVQAHFTAGGRHGANQRLVERAPPEVPGGADAQGGLHRQHRANADGGHVHIVPQHEAPPQPVGLVECRDSVDGVAPVDRQAQRPGVVVDAGVSQDRSCHR